MDGQGRVLLPQNLREKANLIAEVIVAANETHLEVTNRETYEQEMTPLTAEDEIALSKYL
jgi:DNA-binding transcriptional regulator/RsmH inhibitor MraZ